MNEKIERERDCAKVGEREVKNVISLVRDERVRERNCEKETENEGERERERWREGEKGREREREREL